MLAPARRPLWGVLLSLAAGCSHGASLAPEVLAERILPPPDLPDVPASAAPETAMPPPKAATAEGRKLEEVDKKAGQTPPSPDASPRPVPLDHGPCAPLTLPDAIALAFQLQPRLRASLESIEQAQGREDIAFAAFLPLLTSAYSVGGFHVNAGGLSVLVGSPPGFTFIPGLGAIPVGLNINTG
jgi:hypothetical protein